MAKFDSQKALDSLDDPNLKGILLDLLDNISEKDNQIRSLTNRVEDLELRVSECEKCSPKGSIIINNLPPNLLSAYDEQNEHPSELTKGGATAKNSTETPAGDSANVNATGKAPIAKPSKLGLGTITAVDNSSTSDALHSAEEGQHGGEMTPGNAGSEEPEEKTCWEDKPLADDTPENSNKASKFVVDNDSTPTAASNARKVYDRDFLLSKQKAAGSLKKASFTEEPHFKDIVTHSPQFLQPLTDNVPVNDFRDFSQSSHNYGNSSLGGSGNDFAPDYLRRQRPKVSDAYFQA